MIYNHLTSTRSIYFNLKIIKKNRSRRLIIVEKTYAPTKNRRRRLMIKKNVGDGLARPEELFDVGYGLVRHG